MNDPTRARSEPVRVLGFGTYDTSRHPRTGILLAGLTALGAQVSELNEPLGFSTAERVSMLRSPWRAARIVPRLLRCWTALSLRRVRLSALSLAPDAILVGYLGHFDALLARLLFPRTPIALDFLVSAVDTARDRGEGSALKLRLLSILDRIAVAAADIVVVDTDEDLGLVPQNRRARRVVAPVGAASAWFASPEESTPSPGTGSRLKVIFFGLFTPLQGAPTIGAALGQLTDAAIETTMIGTGQDHAATRRLAAGADAVRWIDWVEPARLPALVRESHVCLGIFGDTPKALRVVPNKVFEGAAAGCVIVTSDTPPQRRLLGDAAVYVPPADPDALADALRALASQPGEIERLRKAARSRSDQAFRPHHVAVPLFLALQEALYA